MEQGDEYWMLMKRRQLLKLDFENNNNSINDDSWEERCIWPPRCYSCSFCKREFRSAQALGGHMNVHRRDRAKLKQSLNTTPHNSSNKQTHLFMGFNSLPSTTPSVSGKRLKTAVSSLSFFINPCSTHRYTIQSQVTHPNSPLIEDIDLELRLGDPPRVN